MPKPEEITLRIVEGVYPSKAPFWTFYLGAHEIGRATKQDGGWMVGTKRKPLPTEIHAAKAMIDRMVAKAERDRARAMELLHDLRMHNGGTLPPSR